MNITLIHITRHDQLIIAHERITARYTTLHTCVLPYIHIFALIYLYIYIYNCKLAKYNSSPFTQPSRNVLIFCSYMYVNQFTLNMYNLYNHLAAVTHYTIPPTNELPVTHGATSTYLYIGLIVVTAIATCNLLVYTSRAPSFMYSPHDYSYIFPLFATVRAHIYFIHNIAHYMYICSHYHCLLLVRTPPPTSSIIYK